MSEVDELLPLLKLVQGKVKVEVEVEVEVGEIEGVTYSRSRRTPVSQSWTKEVLDTVWERGCVYTNVSQAYCYMCDTKLEKEHRICVCKSMKNCDCGAWQVEHVIAKSEDFDNFNVLENLLPACASCNSQTWKGSDM
eukprot:TRINITY_DN10620_c0_g1_i1.p1 TRINITY_DN10620_c0_g1~~TRINITY_DN10620_c0_g1_i1.p1  ORF type:complete len:137 (+),score=16.92 TRINITY_DN10620_c0_g1_i1:108-518(+)